MWQVSKSELRCEFLRGQAHTYLNCLLKYPLIGGCTNDKWIPLFCLSLFSFFFPSIHKSAMPPPIRECWQRVTKYLHAWDRWGWNVWKQQWIDIKGSWPPLGNPNFQSPPYFPSLENFFHFSFLFVCGVTRSVRKAEWCILPQPVNGLGLRFGAKCVYLVHCGFLLCFYYNM